MTPLAWFALAGLGTYLSRSLFILAVGDRPLPPRVARFLRSVGPAVLAALTASILTADRLPEYVVSIPEVAGTIAALVVAIWRRHLVWTFLAGVAVWGALVVLLET